jgi:hypothetical protein
MNEIALLNLTALVAQRLGTSPLDPVLKQHVRATAELLVADPTHRRALTAWPGEKGAGHE